MKFFKNFFNTAGEAPTQEVAYEEQATSQNKEILKMFRIAGKLTPSQVHESYPVNVPLTSIRRGITTLTRRGLLVKTDEKVTGPYGRLETVWKAAS